VQAEWKASASRNDSREGEPQLFVIGLRAGRMANRLVLFANLAALAEEEGHRVINFTLHSYAPDFEAPASDIYCQYPPRQRRSTIDRLPGLSPLLRKTRLCHHAVRLAMGLAERLPALQRRAVVLREKAGTETVSLTGLDFRSQAAGAPVVFVYNWRFRAPGLVRKHAGKLRQFFRPARRWEKAAQEAVAPLRGGADVVVGVHIRRGDYQRWQGGRFFYPISEYAGWMRSVARQLAPKKVAFLICSDEPRTAAEFPDFEIGLGAGSPVGDLTALAQCDLILGPPSTFSQWASFYGDVPLLHLYKRGQEVRLVEFAVSDLGDIPGARRPAREAPGRG